MFSSSPSPYVTTPWSHSTSTTTAHRVHPRSQPAVAAAGTRGASSGSALVGARGFVSSAYGAVGHAPSSKALAVADAQRPLSLLFRGNGRTSAPGSPVASVHPDEVSVVASLSDDGSISTVDESSSEDELWGLAAPQVGGNLADAPARASRMRWTIGGILVAAIIAFFCLSGFWPQPALPSALGNADVASRVSAAVGTVSAWWHSWRTSGFSEVDDKSDETKDSALPNQFDVNSGLVINPILTSPSIYHFQAADDRVSVPLLTDRNARNAPIRALVETQSEEDSWCSSTMHIQERVSTTGEPVDLQNPFYGVRAQLAVWLGARIFPDRVVLRSPPPSSFPDPASAPVAVSLWVEIEEDAARTRVWAAILEVSEDQVDVLRPATDDPPARAGFFWTLWKFGLRRALSTVPEPANLALGRTWVRLGGISSEESAWADGRISFPMDADLEALGIPISRTVLRVESNRGQMYTCVYHAELLGKLA